MRKSILVLLVLIVSCTKSLDRTDLESVSRYVESYMIKRDFDSLLALAYPESFKQKSDQERSLNDVIIATSFDPLLEVLDVGELKLVKDYEIEFNQEDQYNKTTSAVLRYYLNIYENIYLIKFRCEKKDGVYILRFEESINLTQSCNDYVNEIYVPQDIICDRIVWQLINNETFKNLEVRLKNNTGNDIEMIKFRLNLFDDKGEEFYSKTIEHKGKLNKGDIERINISDLERFYAGFKLTKSSFNFKVDILSVLPKPYDNSCELIKQLE